jgi:hypothetical protein
MRLNRYGLIGLLAVSALSATGCSRLEDANEGKGYAGKSDAPEYTTGGGQYTSGDFKAGDKESWTEALKVRSQGQNEYNRTPARN